MRRIFQFFPILCTLLLVAFGFGMPRLAALALDRGLEREVTRLEDPAVTLDLFQDADFFHTLELFQSRRSQIQLDEGYQMTEEEAAQASQRIMAALGAWGSVDSAPIVTPYLVSSATARITSGVFWLCLWNSQEGERQVLWLDDQTGLMVAFQGGFPAVMEEYKYAIYREPAYAVAEYCRLYYPAEHIQLLTENPSSDAEYDKQGYGTTYTLSLVRETEDGEVHFLLPLQASVTGVNFNL